MEVPGCAGLPGILQKVLQKTDIALPVKQVVVNPMGEINDEMVF